MTALSSAIVLIISPSIKDPNLIWPFVGIACACFISGVSILFVRPEPLSRPPHRCPH